VFAEVRRQRNRQALIGLLTIAAAAAVLAVAMRQVVVRPIRDLGRVAQRIGEGDFETRAATAARDEIAALRGAPPGTEAPARPARLPRPQQHPARRTPEPAAPRDTLQATRQRVELLEQLKGELSKFVPDAVKELLDRDPTATALEKRNEEVSVLFLDIAGYTR